MESNGARWNYARRQRRQQPNSLYNRPEQGSLQYSSPLPQTEWIETTTQTISPLQRQTSLTDQAPDSSRHLSSPVSPIADWQREVERQTPPINAYLLYSFSDPFSDRLSMHSAPDDLEYFQTRSNDDNSNTTGYLVPGTPDSPVPPSMARQSTHPPRTTMRRTHTTIAIPDNTFADEAEFNLFAQATTGLGMEEPFSAPFTAVSLFSSHAPPTRLPRPRLEPPSSMALQRSTSDGLPYSPSSQSDSNTPTIAQAIQQLEHLLGEDSFTTSPPAGDVRRQRSLSELDLHPSALHAASLDAEVSAMEEESEDFDDDDDDDELPDYAASQAQAQAHRRLEAARRARELHRRWQLSGSARPT